MKAVLAGLFLVGLVALSSLPNVAATLNFNLNYSDPASDVMRLWTSTMTPVLNATGSVTLSPDPASVNLLRIESANASADVNLTIIVKGDVANLANTSYEFRLFTRADNASYFIVTYENGTTTLSSTAIGFVPKDISGRSTITSSGGNPTLLNTLRISVAEWLLAPITAWNIDAVATQRGPTYTFQDYGWEVPGNPGSAPSPGPSALPWIWLAVIPVVIAVALAALVVLIHRRSVQKKQ